MAYCIQADIEKSLGLETLISLTDDEDQGSVNSGRVNEIINEADAEIDGYVGVRESVPLLPVPVIIKKYSVDIAIYNLFGRRGGAPEYWVNQYNNAISFLEKYVAGKATLGINDPSDLPKNENMPEFSTTTKVFTRSTMSGY